MTKETDKMELVSKQASSGLNKKEEFHLTSYSKWDDLDSMMNVELSKRFGTSFSDYRRNWKKTYTQAYVPNFPLMIGIEAADACNYRCKMCYRHDHKNTQHCLGLDTVKAVIDEGSMHQLPAVVFGAGADEPFMEPNMMKILEHCRKQNIMDILVTTNGSLLTEDKIDTLIELEITRLQISLDAAGQDVYSKIRGGKLEPIENMIRYCFEHKKKRGKMFPIIRLSFVVQDENRNESDLFLEKWKDIADKIDLQKYVDFGNVEAPRKKPCIDLFCAEPWQRVNIWADGTITPCCTFYSKYFALGNIHTHRVAEAWQNPVINRLRKSLSEKKFHKVCINCTGDL